MCLSLNYLKSSIGKKQVVATTGLMLILFVIGHLAGNLFMFGGPNAFNHYAEKLRGLRPALYVVEYGLLFVFLTHIFFTYLVVLENIQARGVGYAVSKSVGERSFATRLMPYTGTFLLAFVIWHLIDFTFVDRLGPQGVLPDGKNYELYGVVYNAFMNPVHSGLYIVAMFCLGFHLAHGVQSFAQTFGFNSPRLTPLISFISNLFGFFIAIGFSTIPVFVLLDCVKYKVLL